MENLLFVNHVRTSFTQLATSGNTFGHNSFPSPSLNPTIADNIFRDNCNNVDKTLSIRCNHQLSISSGTSSISMQVTEKKSKFDAEGLQNKKNVDVASSPFSELYPPSIHQVGNSLSSLNKPFENELVVGQMTSNEGSFCLMEQNFSPTSGSRTQEPALMKALSRNSHGSNLFKKSEGVSIPGYLKPRNGLLSSGIPSGSCGSPFFNLQDRLFGSSSIFLASQETETAGCDGDDSLKVEKLQKYCAENDSSSFLMSNEKSPFFSQLATSGDDLFDVLGLYDSRSHQLNLSSISYPAENSISCC